MVRLHHVCHPKSTIAEQAHRNNLKGLFMVRVSKIGHIASFPLIHDTSVNKSSLVYITTQVNSTLCARWLANSEVISQVLFTSEQLKKNMMAFVGILSQIKLLFGLLVISGCVVYILKQILFTSVWVEVVYNYELLFVILGCCCWGSEQYWSKIGREQTLYSKSVNFIHCGSDSLSLTSQNSSSV